MQGDFYIKKKKIYVKNVNIDTSGQLSILLSDLEKENIEEFALNGKMNDSDFKIINDMDKYNKLSFIDLSETNIISDEVYNSIDYSTKNDEFGYKLFIGCKKFEKIIFPSIIEEIGEITFWNC